MLDYRNDLRIVFSASRGALLEEDELSRPYPSALDEDIIRIGGLALRGRELQTFTFLYSCKDSWEDVQMMFLKHLRVELTVESLQRYSRNAKKRIMDKLSENAARRRPLDIPPATFKG
jgi:hypothetical protein